MEFQKTARWWLLESPLHKGVQNLIKALNSAKKQFAALYEKAFEWEGFEWIAGDDVNNSVLLFLRHGSDTTPSVLVACNFGSNSFTQYGVGVKNNNGWKEVLNTDHTDFGG